MKCLRILGVRVDNVRIGDAVDRIERFVRDGAPRQVVTVNPEFVILARRDPQFKRVLEAASLAVADGIGIVWAARILGRSLPERIGGVDLVDALAARSARSGIRLFFLGAGEGVAQAAARRLTARYPGCVIAGTHAGSPADADADAIVERIRAAATDILLVAYGAPAQDLWIARHQPRTGAPVAIGVGGAFDYLSGRVPRAPRALQRVGLEWLYRLARQPWRWRRMRALPRFAALVLIDRLSERGAPDAAP